MSQRIGRERRETGPRRGAFLNFIKRIAMNGFELATWSIDGKHVTDALPLRKRTSFNSIAEQIVS